MSSQCKDLDKLSANRKWDDVFHCLKIDVNSTIELGSLKARVNEQTYEWLDHYKATMNSLEVILSIILLFDEIIYFILMFYLTCFAIKIIRYRGLKALWQLTQILNSLEKRIEKQNECKSGVAKKKTLTFAENTLDNAK